MKKFLLLFVMLSGMLMQHELLADTYTADGVEIVVNGKTVTINATNAGALSAYLNSGQASAAIAAIQAANGDGSSIVFDGNFNQSDLQALSTNNCCVQKKVDMYEAKFIASTSSSSKILYHAENDKQSTAEGNHCLVGAVKYKVASSRSTWVPVEESEIPINSDGSKQVTLKTPEEFASYVNNDYQQWIQVPATYRYYKMEVTMNGYDQVRTWVLVEEEDVPEDAVIKTPTDFTEDQRNNNLYYCNDGEYIRFGATYNYYTNPETLIWKDVSGTGDDYQNGTTSSYCYSSLNNAPAPTNEIDAIYVGGKEYVYNNGSWTEPQSSGDGNYDYTQMKFDYWGNNVEEIITSKYAEGPMVDQLCNSCSNLKTLTLSAGDFALAGTVLGNNINNLETVNIKKDVTTLSPSMFNGIGTLNTVDFEDGCQIKTLPTGVFRSTGITEIEIPSSVELIEPEAFHSCPSLETVTFVNTNTNPLIIKNRAFQNSQNIKDVYVNVKFSDRHMICEYNAFDFKSMEGQTDENAQMTTLHFPEDDNSFNYYAGEWKKGMAIKQENLNAFKDGLVVTYNGQEYINAPTQDQSQLTGGYAQVDNSSDGYYHPSDNSKKYAPANGWQQFAKTDSEREIFVKGNIYMTYSTDKAYSLPTGIVAFRVTDYKEATVVNGKTTLGKLVLKMINQVPTQTGMLLISTDQYVVKNENVMSVFFFGDPDGTPTQYHYTQGHAGDATSNYLAPAVHGIEVGPVSKGQPNAVTGAIDVNGSPFTHRNFAMNKNTHQFVRVKHIIMPDNRAFLSLPKEMFTNNNESATEGPNPWNTKAGDAFDTYETTQYDSEGAKTMMFFEYDVEKYGMIWPLAQKEDVTDGIDLVLSNSNAERVQEGIFTLQGVKVAQPTEKGVYIVNGKKVIIK